MRYALTVFGALATFAIAACAGNPTNQQIGTGVGAAAGGAIGNVMTDSTAGTIGGAAAGALIGNELGRRQDEQNQK